MGTFFNALLEKRNLDSAPIPLWKLKIIDEEYEELKNVLNAASQEEGLYKFRQEAALFYAECFRREYNGGHISKEFIARQAKIEDNRNAEELFNQATRALFSLKIPLITHNNTLYFRTLLLQGGLPIGYILRKDSGFNRYQEFLKRMLVELASKNVNWDDVELVKNLSCIRYLAPSYQNENIYAISLQIIHAISVENEDLLPYQMDSSELKELTDILKKVHNDVKKRIITHPLKLQWFLKIEENTPEKKGFCTYTLDNVKTIFPEMIPGINEDSCYQFDIYVSKEWTCTYKKVYSNDTTLYKCVRTENLNFNWNGETAINIQAICDNDDTLIPSVVNNSSPNFEFPQMFQKKGNEYIQQSGDTSAECIAIFSEKWIIEKDIPKESLTINEETFNLVKFPEFKESESLSFKNTETGEVFTLKNQTSRYSAIFEEASFPWVASTNQTLLNKRPVVKVYNKTGLLDGYKQIYYRERGETVWNLYKKESLLKPGKVDIKVEFYDGSFEIKSFYYIGDLKFHVSDASENKATITCTKSFGKICPVKQENHNYTPIGNSGTEWIVERNPNLENIEATCNFEIEYNGNPTLKINIPCPYKGIYLLKGNNLVPNNSSISTNELADYNIIVSGNPDNDIEIKGYNQTIKQQLKDGIYPLYRFEESIKKIFYANGSKLNSIIKLCIKIVSEQFKIYQNINESSSKLQSCSICYNPTSTYLNYTLRYYTLRSRVNEILNTIELHTLDKKTFINEESQLLACKIEEYDSEIQPKILNLSKLQTGHYLFPEETKTGDYLVFSDAYDKARIIPNIYKYQDGIIRFYKKEEAFSYKKQSAENWTNKLEESSVESFAWQQVLNYIEIANKHNLPFKTFNAITAAVSSTELATKLLVSIYINAKCDEMLSALLKIEQEFAMAFHWTKSKIIQSELSVLCEKYQMMSDTIKSKFYEFFKDLMQMTLEPNIAGKFTDLLFGFIENEKPDILSNAQIQSLASKAHSTFKENQAFSLLKFPLTKIYYNISRVLSFPTYIQNFIDIPIYVYEYTQGWNDCLWENTPEAIRRREVINYYRQFYKDSYYEILIYMLE